MASNQVKPTGNYVIMELTPATWYNLRISAHNNAGSSVAEYECATLTVTGGKIITPTYMFTPTYLVKQALGIFSLNLGGFIY